MRRILILLILLLFSAKSEAADLLFITNGSPTGINGQQAKIFVDTIKSFNFNVELKTTNVNCALAKLIWTNSNKPTLMLVVSGLDNQISKENPACYLDIKKEDIIFWVYSIPYAFCSAGNKKWKDFTEPGSTHTVVIHPDNKSVELFNMLSKRFNNTIKTIKTNTAANAMILAKSGEIDFLFRTGLLGFEDLKDKCLWTSLPVQNLPTMQEYIHDINNKHYTFNGFIIGKNINNINLIPMLSLALNSTEMVSLHNSRGVDNTLVEFKSNEEYLNRLKELLSQLDLE